MQKERLENVTSAVSGLSEKLEKGQETLRGAVESRLDAIRQENAIKLDAMRQTVDEKLQSTLEARLGESFNRVVEHLERVHKGIGEMQTLAANVGDLKNVSPTSRFVAPTAKSSWRYCLSSFYRPISTSKTQASARVAASG